MSKPLQSFILTHAIIALTFFNAIAQKPFSFPKGITDADYDHNMVIVKVKQQFRELCSVKNETVESSVSSASGIAGSTVQRLFSKHAAPDTERNISGQRLTDLSLVYKITFNAEVSIPKVINQLMATGNFIYAEPQYIYQAFYLPSDTLATMQYHHNRIHSFDGWDINKGDTNIVIGITDTGFDTIHAELVNQIKYNYLDPVNGLDDDADGYIDNYMGWNMAFNNTNINSNPIHGTFVAGVGCAQTDNVTGIAGVGFKTKFLPVSCSPGTNVIVNGDLAIIYAADHGASIINCSWGGFGASQFSQDVINYATINKNCLVVGAAGNANADAPFYPASYQYVLSVAGSDTADVRWVSSSFGSYVDVSAPGFAIYSIFPTGSANPYGYSGGTSEAAPQVSAAAAIVKAQFPTLSGLQIGERLRVTADDIDTIPGNATWIKQLGKGRINLFRALTEPAKSVRALDIDINDGNDNAFAGNDTLNISAVFTNYLDAVGSLTATLSCNSGLINILNPVLNLGSLATLQSDSNRANPFRAVIDPSIPLNQKIVFTITFQDGTYNDWQKFETTVNVDYINVLVNDVGVSITSKGRLGYNDAGNTQGIGFTHNDGPSLLYGGGFIVGVNDSMVVDATFGTPAGNVNNDFIPSVFVHKIIPSVYSDFDLTTTFTDGGSSLPVGIDVDNNVFAWGSPADRKYVITEYIITNYSANNYTDLHGGIYMDWDITAATYVNNRAEFDSLQRLGYAYYTNANNQYVGIKLLSPGFPNYYAYNNDGTAGSFSIYDGYTRAEKYQSMHTFSRMAAGTTGAGSDVSMLLSSGPFPLNSGGAVSIAFALVAGDSLAEVIAASAAAQIMYDSLALTANQNQYAGSVSVFPNPFDNTVSIAVDAESNSVITIMLVDVSGRTVFVSAERQIHHGKNLISVSTENLPSGFYFLKTSVNGKQNFFKLVKK